MMISSIPSPITRRVVIAALNTSRTSSFVHHPASSHARRRRRRAHFRYSEAEHCRVRHRRARRRTRSVVVVHSFDDPVYTYSRGFNPIYLLPVCKHARTHERSFCRSSTSVRTRAITKREKNDESQTIKFSMNRRIVLSTCTGIVRDGAVRGWDVFVRTRG